MGVLLLCVHPLQRLTQNHLLEFFRQSRGRPDVRKLRAGVFHYRAISARGRLTSDVLQLRAAGDDAYRRHWPGPVGLHVPARSQFGLNLCPIDSE